MIVSINISLKTKATALSELGTYPRTQTPPPIWQPMKG